METYLLPYVEEPLPKRHISIRRLEKHLKSFLGNDQLTEILIRVLEHAGYKDLTLYQFENLKSLLTSKKSKLGLIVAPVGSGKTVIFLIYAIAKLLKLKNSGESGKSVFIYPTKSLSRDQLQDILKLVSILNRVLKSEDKSELVLKVSINDSDSPKKKKDIKKLIEKIGKESGSRRLSFRGITCTDSHGKQHPIEYRLINGSPRLYCGNEEIDFLSEYKFEDEDYDIVITNRSQFSTNLYYSFVEERSRMLNNIKLLVIDEAHVYLDKEEGDFLFYSLIRYFIRKILSGRKTIDEMAQSSTLLGDLAKALEEEDFDIIFSSGTITNKALKPEGATLSNVIGASKQAVYKKNSKVGSIVPEEIHAYLSFILGPIYDGFFKNNLVYHDYDSLIDDYKSRKIIFPTVIFSNPTKSSQNAYIEMLSTLLLWCDGISRRLEKIKKSFSAIAFVDNKESQRQIFTQLINRGIHKERFHIDKLLLTHYDLEDNENKRRHGFYILDKVLSEYSDEPLMSVKNKLFDYAHIFLYYDYTTLYKNRLRRIGQFKQAVIDNRLPKTIPSINGFVNVIDIARDIWEAANNWINNKTSETRNYLKSNLHPSSNLYYIILHNADLKKHIRQKLENILKGDNKTKWRLVLSTSTLELGLNLKNVGIILQFGLSRESDSLLQRFGRAGRYPETFHIIFGILYARNYTGDIKLLDEELSFEKIFNRLFWR